MKPNLSILLAAPKDPAHLRRALWAIAFRRPKADFEVILASERREDLDELAMFSTAFPYTFALLSDNPLEHAFEVGQKEVYERNVEHLARGQVKLRQDGRCIAWEGAYDAILAVPGNAHANVYEVPDGILSHLDAYGSNLTPNMVKECERCPYATDLFVHENADSLLFFTHQDGNAPSFSGTALFQGGDCGVRLSGVFRTDILEVVSQL